MLPPLPLAHSRPLSTLVACLALLAGLSTLGTACRLVNTSQALKRCFSAFLLLTQLQS